MIPFSIAMGVIYRQIFYKNNSFKDYAFAAGFFALLAVIVDKTIW